MSEEIGMLGDGIRISAINNYVACVIQRNKETLEDNRKKYEYYSDYYKALMEAKKEVRSLGLVGKILTRIIDRKIVKVYDKLSELFKMPAYSLHYFYPQTKSEEEK